MKRATYAGGSIITESAVTAALLDYATQVAGSASSVTVDIPVLESNGTTSIHTLLLGPASQFDVAGIDGASAEKPCDAVTGQDPGVSILVIAQVLVLAHLPGQPVANGPAPPALRT